MQEDCEDYSDLVDSGCCLDCSESFDGCLCYKCKCRKCFHYSSPQETGGDKGSCDLAFKYAYKKKYKSKREWLLYNEVWFKN